jgi:hypothetical protein
MEMNPTEFCMCGCGGLAPIAKQNHKARGLVKGEPMRFIHGHHARGREKTEDEIRKSVAGFKKWLETNPHPAQGKPVSDETRRKIGDANRGEKSGLFKDKKSIRNGYVWVYVGHDHPLVNKGRNGRALEHRVVASEKLGRWVRPDEDVHHLNGDKQDNRPENLLVIDHAKHGLWHRVRMTEDEIANVRAMIEQGMTDKQIAADLTLRRFETRK